MTEVEAERKRCADVALDCAQRAEKFISEKCAGNHNDIQRWAEACRHVAGLIMHGDDWYLMQQRGLQQASTITQGTMQ